MSSPSYNIDVDITTTKEQIGDIISVLESLNYMTNDVSRHIFPRLSNLSDSISKIREEVLKFERQSLAAYASYVKPGAYAFRRKSKKSTRKGKKSMRKTKRSARK